MPRHHHVVIVAQNPALATALLSWLGTGGYELAIATTFASGKALLETEPALVISEVKLGEYNGLHLALKASSAGIPAIVIGPRDKVLEKDAEDLGVQYISSVLRRKQLLELVAERLQSPVAPKRLADAGKTLWQVEHDQDLIQAIPANRTVLH